MLTVVEMLYQHNNSRRTYCRCICDCGNEKIIEASHLQSRNNLSCGCMTTYYRTLHNRTNEIGKKYNMLEIIDIDYSVKPSIAVCKCDCGNIKRISKADVVSGHIKSCGCLQKRIASKVNTKDFFGIISESGVKLINKNQKNKNGVWLWNCICPLCGNIFSALPAKVLSNHTTSCGCKIQSSKERIIKSYLNNLGLKYETQKRFDDCKYKYTLPFDFAIYDNNDHLICLLEYDGEQHYRPVDFYGGIPSYENTKLRDRIKTNYCKKNNIKLLRLNYLDSNNEIINKITNTIYP